MKKYQNVKICHCLRNQDAIAKSQNCNTYRSRKESLKHEASDKSNTYIVCYILKVLVNFIERQQKSIYSTLSLLILVIPSLKFMSTSDSALESNTEDWRSCTIKEKQNGGG